MKTLPRLFGSWSVLLALLLQGCLFAGGARPAATPDPQPSLRAFAERIPALRAQIPAVTAAADAAARRMLAHPDALLNVPYWEQISFSEEMINRAGGLANAYPGDAPDRGPATSNDVILLSVRDWTRDGSNILKRVTEGRTKGWMTTLIASRVGCPSNLPELFFIDNAAPTAGAADGPVNLLANVTLGWMWCCEYAAAMTRQGRIPAILITCADNEGAAYDQTIQTREGRHRTFPCAVAIPPGRLAELYLQRVERLLTDLRTPRIQQQLAGAADVIAARMASGGTVGLSGVGHVIIDEVKRDTQAPWKAFQAVGAPRRAFKAALKPGDLLVWIAYCGMNSKYDDYGKYIAEAQVDLVTSYAPDPVWAAHPPKALAHIDQCWTLPDAEIPVPGDAKKMAPVSGVNSGLILRMLDDEVAARLTRMRAAGP